MFFQIQFALVLQVLVLLTRASSVGRNRCAETTTPLQGTFVGNCLEDVEEYLGIPYATPPVDALRFSKTTPLPKYSSSRKRLANEPGSACRQPPFPFNDVQKSYAEDCLYLNIYAPRKIEKRLPVLFWIHGGAFLNGAGSGEQFNATKLLTQSIKLREPVVFVSINYRLGAFGFLGGSAIANAAKEGKAALNAGYYDQREALHWVQRNIASFGGDPKKVTIFGESAGANSVGQQMLAKEGDVQGLFRAAIMQSGNPSVSRRLPPSHPFAQDGYNAFLAGAGCSLATSEIDQLRCLRSASSDTLNDANTKAASGKQAAFVPLQDDFFVRGLPSAQFKRGAFPDIPYIQGDNLDEGTLFALASTNVTSDDEFSKTVTSTYGAELGPLLPQILKLWPSSPAKGSPYEPQLFGKSPDDTYFPPSSTGEPNQFKRIAAFGGDVLFESGRRQQLYASKKGKRPKSWNYRFAQPLPLDILSTVPTPNVEAQLGIPHATDVNFVFGKPVLAGALIQNVSEPLRSFTTDPKVKEIATIMTSAWIHFANHLDPNGKDVPSWPEFHSRNKPGGSAGATTLFLQGGHTRLEEDHLQEQQTKFILDHAQDFFI